MSANQIFHWPRHSVTSLIAGPQQEIGRKEETKVLGKHLQAIDPCFPSFFYAASFSRHRLTASKMAELSRGRYVLAKVARIVQTLCIMPRLVDVEINQQYLV